MCYLETGPRRLMEQFGKLRALYGRWERDRHEEALHRVRIQFKKLRYTGEIYTPLYGKEMKQFTRRLKDAQECLGQWNDQRILRNYLRQDGDLADPSVSECLEPFGQELDRSVAELLRRFSAGAGPFFSGPEQNRMTAFLSNPHRSCCVLFAHSPG